MSSLFHSSMAGGPWTWPRTHTSPDPCQCDARHDELASHVHWDFLSATASSLANNQIKKNKARCFCCVMIPGTKVAHVTSQTMHGSLLPCSLLL
jgi:hypothetical protein